VTKGEGVLSGVPFVRYIAEYFLLLGADPVDSFEVSKYEEGKYAWIF
jgi:hypothetical protein